MIYQLPTGKIIYITVEQFLSLSDDELQSLTSMDIGEYARSPWTGSSLSKKKKQLEEEEDSSIDYSEESEEFCYEKPILREEGSCDISETPDEEFLD